VALPPGGRAQYDRVFAIAPRGDPIALATEFFFMQGGAPGGVAVKLTDASGAPFSPPPSSRLFFDRAGTAGNATTADAPPEKDRGARWMRPSRTPEGSLIFGGEVPPGRYSLRFEGGGRREARGATIEIKPGATTSISLEVSDAEAH
jgi:hypothetical protein